MIAKITNGTRVGEIAAYLHGPGRANEHRFEVAGRTYIGGRVIDGNLGYEGHTEPDQWVQLMRQALSKRPGGEETGVAVLPAQHCRGPAAHGCGVGGCGLVVRGVDGVRGAPVGDGPSWR